MGEYIVETYAAFAGAFCAYIFLRFAESMGKLYERRAKHYEAIVRLEHMANRLLDDIGTDLYEIDQIISNHEAATKAGQITVTGNRPKPLEYDDSILYDLHNLDLINEIFSYYRRIERFNNDITGLAAIYDFFKDAYVQDQAHKDNYLRNFALYVSRLKEVRPHLQHLFEKTKRISAISILRGQRDRPGLNRLLSSFIRKRNERTFESDIPAALAIVESDLAKISARCKAEIVSIKEKK
ncbi:MAG: hypothetical protein PHR77_16085 [Kiritimatiellae bacterium]|nr:hypothetical protein [Kiritimatiellia bacterium]MDD5523417.1 hypothetical protein [Kiritimatiellia bacterium]